MKKSILFITLCLHFCIGAIAQQKGDPYRRNSLCTFFITDFGRLDNSVMSSVDFACQNYNVPLKYDSHDIGVDKTIQVRNIELKGKNKPKQGFLEKMGRKLAAVQGLDYDKELEKQNASFSKSTQEQIEKDEIESHLFLFQMPNRLTQFLEDHKIANILLAKWFNASNTMMDDSYYDMKLIQDRGVYSASELDKLRAAESVRGRAILADAGMELLSHTYVTFTYFDYTTSQEATKNTQKVGNKIFGNSSYLGEQWNKVTNDEIKNVSGYWVKATTYLFRLKWNQSLEDLFINKYWNAPVSTLLNSDEFQMEYVGCQSSPTVHYEERTGKGVSGNVLVAGEATIRAIDASLGNLQRKFEDFRVKAPLIDVNESEITAFIGTKEGVEMSSSFEVLERTYNEKKNRFDYKKVSLLKIDKKHPIFDNNYVLGQDEEPVGKTYFKGNFKILAPGMLIRQTK